MNYKKFGKKYVIRINKGEKIVDTLRKICVENNITFGILSGIGAVSNQKKRNTFLQSFQEIMKSPH